MKCTEVKQNSDAFFDGEIVSAQRDLIETHLENCGFCQTEFENLESVRRALKHVSPVSAPPFLDEKVLNAFRRFHEEKRPAEIAEKPQKQRTGWFTFPGFAFAGACLLFILSVISAFQIGRMSAGEITVVMPQISENASFNSDDVPPVKIVEVPAVVERIVKVPVIEEKIVVKTVYVAKDKENETRTNLSENNSSALKNSVENNGYLTQTDLKGFQPVSEINLKISKEVDNNEK